MQENLLKLTIFDRIWMRFFAKMAYLIKLLVQNAPSNPIYGDLMITNPYIFSLSIYYSL